MCVPREGHADGSGGSLLCKLNTCAWIRLLRKPNIPSVLGQNYLLVDLLPLLKKPSSVCALWRVAALLLSLPPVATHVDFWG